MGDAARVSPNVLCTTSSTRVASRRFRKQTMTPSRRVFILRTVSGVGALSAASGLKTAYAQTPEALTETDPQAIALGYKLDGTQTDKQKYPSYNATQRCSGCVLFQGKAGDASASCAAFGNKLVAGKAWCSAWTKRA
jgi:hypothetical protein